MRVQVSPENCLLTTKTTKSALNYLKRTLADVRWHILAEEFASRTTIRTGERNFRTQFGVFVRDEIKRAFKIAVGARDGSTGTRDGEMRIKVSTRHDFSATLGAVYADIRTAGGDVRLHVTQLASPHTARTFVMTIHLTGWDIGHYTCTQLYICTRQYCEQQYNIQCINSRYYNDTISNV